jgi:asparagine synthase (glutamine-hydrolysing)
LAREIAPVRLTGNYGSEILRSAVAFRPSQLDETLFTPEFCQLLREAAETYRQEATGHRLSFIAFKQVPWHHFGRRAVESSQLMPRSPFLDNDLVALAYRCPAGAGKDAAPLLRLIAAGNPALAAVATDRAQRHDSRPFITRLVRTWQEFTAKAEYAYDYGMPARLARVDHRVASLHLERLFLGRHKFYHFRIWYRDHFRGYLKARLASGCTLPFYREGAPGRIISEHLSGRVNRTLDLHKLLSLQLLEELLLEDSRSGSRDATNGSAPPAPATL